MITPSTAYVVDHVRAELSRGHVHRCPRSWLLVARTAATFGGDDGLVLACDIAVEIQRSGSNRNPRLREMRIAAGRQLQPSKETS